MSVESEILRIQHNLADSYAAVASKHGEVPLQPTSENLAAAVASIPQVLPPPDNNPIGTVISFMGTAAAENYLVCDGAAYSISEYPALASFFQAQFGVSNHFGGDGTATFAVPDMRNLFLRGYRGEAEEQLSGEIGSKQEGTSYPYVWVSDAVSGSTNSGGPENADSTISSTHAYKYGGSTGNAGGNAPLRYTARPVNMAVLYCIKAKDGASGPSVESYDTDDGWHVRKHSDGFVELSAEVTRQAGTWNRVAGFYYSEMIDPPEFPFPLTVKYEESVGLTDTKVESGALVRFETTPNGNGSLLKPRSYWLISTQTDISEFGVRYYVSGRWKE